MHETVLLLLDTLLHDSVRGLAMPLLESGGQPSYYDPLGKPLAACASRRNPNCGRGKPLSPAPRLRFALHDLTAGGASPYRLRFAPIFFKNIKILENVIS